jgi:putative flippase GtrA
MIKSAKKLLSTIDKKSFTNYVIVGFTSAGLYFGTFVVFYRWVHLHYIIAISIAYITSMIFNFTANRCITFAHQERKWHLQLMKYLCVALLNYLISLITAHIVV